MRLSLRTLSSIMSTNNSARTFLFWFSNEHSNFRISEFEALFKVFRLDEKILQNRRVNGPFILLNFMDEDGPRKLMSRSVLTHACYELWGAGNTKEEMDQEVKTNLELMASPFVNDTFQIRVETCGKTIHQSEKIKLIEDLLYLPMKGKVDLRNAECSLHLILYYGLYGGEPKAQEPFHLYFGRWIADGQRKLVTQISLKNRKFIGNTSMDPLLSLLMVNLAATKPYDIVLDPFVGTGSILVAAAAVGGHILGSDIDYLMLHGRTKPTKAFQVTRTAGESIRANMIQYGLENKYLDVVIGDASRQLWRDDFRVDSIITDPPYGIRESTERLGSSKPQERNFKLHEEYEGSHYPAKQEYCLTDIFCDLMNFAVNRLNIGGRLVYWIPISRTEYEPENLPNNPCLKLVSNGEQVFTSYASRRLLVFEKTQEPTSLCQNQTEMDGSSLMYRFKIFEIEERKIRKAEAYSKFGKANRKGCQVVQELKISNS